MVSWWVCSRANRRDGPYNEALCIPRKTLGWAQNTREAIALLEQDEPIDILFTDINLPDGPDAIDGLELARKAVELCRGLRVIYTTGHGQTDGMTALFVEDAIFLPKPYTAKQLTEAVLATAEQHPR